MKLHWAWLLVLPIMAWLLPATTTRAQGFAPPPYAAGGGAYPPQGGYPGGGYPGMPQMGGMPPQMGGMPPQMGGAGWRRAAGDPRTLPRRAWDGAGRRVRRHSGSIL